MIDEIQWRYTRVTHEGAHAVAMHLYGHKIREIDCDRPEADVAGWVLDDTWDTPLNRVRRRAHEKAVVLRIGALVTNMDWERDPLCANDRAGVRKIAEILEIPVTAFEMIVESDAADMLRDPRFDVAHRALCRELLDHLHEVMPGWRAHQIMNDALWRSLAPNEDYSLRV
jgi:hypothetical protein